MVVPKRAALLFDRLMVALQKVVDNQNKELDGSRPFARSPHLSIENSQIIPSTDDQTMKVSLSVYLVQSYILEIWSISFFLYRWIFSDEVKRKGVFIGVVISML